MAQNKNSPKKSQGICKKICNIAMSPFTPRNQSTISQTIPIDYNHFSSQNSKKMMREKEHNLDNEREKVIAISNGGLAKAKSKANDDYDSINHEGKFSDYINKTKNRLMKTLSTVSGGGNGGGGGGGGGISSRRDSFNDKVTNYINRAKIKIRTTSNVADK